MIWYVTKSNPVTTPDGDCGTGCQMMDFIGINGLGFVRPVAKITKK